MMDSGNGTMLTMPVQPAYSGNNGNGFGWGGDGAWWLILLFLFAFGGFGGYGMGGYGANGAGLQGLVTRADINDGFAINNLQSGINAIQQGICDATYALNNALKDGFFGVQSMISNLGAQLAQCCCNIQSMIQDIKYEIAQSSCNIINQMNMNTRDIVDNQNNGFRSILDWLCQEKIDAKNEKIAEQAAQIQALQLQKSQSDQNAYFLATQEAQTAELIRRLGADCPQPAYVVQPPQTVSFPLGCNGQLNVYGNNGCGYSNGCGNSCSGCGC